jgi:hypothetical protein
LDLNKMAIDKINSTNANDLTAYDIQNSTVSSDKNIYSGSAEKTTLTLLDKLLNDSRNSTASVEEMLALAKSAVELIPPNMDFETAVLVMEGLFQKLGDSQVADAKRSLTTKEKKITEYAGERMKKIQDRIDRIRSQAEAEKKKQTGADVGLGFSTAATAIGILAFFATVLTGGLALPFLVAAAVGTAIGTITTSMDVANRIVQADPNATETDPFGNKRHKEVSFGRAFRLAQEDQESKLIAASGGDISKLPEDKKAEMTKRWQKTESDGNTAMTVILVAATIACALPSIVSGIKDIIKNGLSAVLKGASSTKEITQNTVETTKKVLDLKKSAAIAIAEATEAAASVAGSVGDITSGAYGLQLADINFDIKTIDNQKTLYDALSRQEQNTVDFMLDHIEKIMDMLEKFTTNTATSISNLNQLNKSVIRVL